MKEVIMDFIVELDVKNLISDSFDWNKEVDSFLKNNDKAINYTRCCTELNHDFERGEDVWFIEKKIVEISDFCASPDRVEIIEDGKYKIVDIDNLNKVV